MAAAPRSVASHLRGPGQRALASVRLRRVLFRQGTLYFYNNTVIIDAAGEYG